MGQPTFADRYAEAGLNPNAQLIINRSESAKRIVDSITAQKILDLAAAYYESPDVDLEWFRDEFATDDASFSLVNNEREVRVLAAALLDQLLADGNSVAILSVIAGHVVGKRQPSQSEWLVTSARSANNIWSVRNRARSSIPKVVSTLNKELAQEVANIAVEPDWSKLATTLGKIRTEAQDSAKSIAGKSNAAFEEVNNQMQLMREETQMLWWLFGGYSRLLEKDFKNFDHQQAAIISAADLGTLTTWSQLGPLAAPAMLERVIALSKKPKGSSTRALSEIVDSIVLEDNKKLEINAKVPSRLAPVTEAITLARTLGFGLWHTQFKSRTGFDASIAFEPLSLAEQLYRESLLGQML